MRRSIGFVGTGAITSAMVTGLSGESIHLSPRNAEIARALARRFPNVSIASSNQEVLDRSEIVVLAVRPAIAVEVIAALRFRPDHHVISVISGFRPEGIAAATVVRAVPLPSVAKRMGPTAVFPPDPLAAELFNAIGTAIEVHTEHEFNAFCAATATIAPYFAFIGGVASWLARNGIPASEARDYTERMIRGLMVEQDFDALTKEHATPGGINEQLLHHLMNSDVFDSLSRGLDAVLRRLES